MQFFRDIAGLNRNIHIFLLGEVFFGIGAGISSLLLNLHFLALGLSVDTVGTLVALDPAVGALLALPAGIYAQRLGRRRMLLSATVLIALSTFLSLQPVLWELYLSRALLALGNSALFTSEFPVLLSHARNREEHRLAFSLVFTVFMGFSGVGNLIGGFLPNWLPAGNTVYEWPLVISGVMILMVTVLRLRLGDAGESPARAAAAVGGRRAATVRAVSPRLLKFGLVAILGGAVFGAVAPLLNVIVLARYQVGTEAMGIFFTLGSFAVSAGALLAAPMTRKWGEARAYVAGQVGSGLLALAQAWAPSFALFAPLQWGRSAIMTAGNNVLDSALFGAVHDQERTVYSGYRTVGRFLGSTVAAKLSSVFLSGGHATWTLLLAAAATGASIFFYAWVVRPEVALAERELQGG